MKNEIINAIKMRRDAAQVYYEEIGGVQSAIYGEYWRDVSELIDALEESRDEIIHAYEKLELLSKELDIVKADLGDRQGKR